MRKSTVLRVVLACAMGALAGACGGDDSGGSSNDADAGPKTDGGSAGSDGKMDPDPINNDCPTIENDIGPDEGMYAPKGACCYRRSNSARIDPKADTMTLEYRFNYFQTINHNATLGGLAQLTVDRYDREEQSILLRLVLPNKDGKLADGEGMMTIGTGRYNCDGTYSFYDDTAAPTDSGNGDPGRWAPSTLKATVDTSKTDVDRVKVSYADSLEASNRITGLAYLGSDLKLDWELLSMGFDITAMTWKDDEVDCFGSLGASGWKPAGKTYSYSLVDVNAHDVIDALGVQLCQLFGFGSAAKPDDPKYDCKKTPRCMPGSSDCTWKRLPDSLCPTTDADKKKWTCHLGYDGNPDNPQPNCSMDPPDKVNPDDGTVEGQCCDPLASGKDGLPACNAWLTINEFTAAAAEITDDPKDSVQPDCHGQ